MLISILYKSNILQELIEVQKRDLQEVSIGKSNSFSATLIHAAPVSDDNLLHWKGTIQGPQNTPYKVQSPYRHSFCPLLFSETYSLCTL